MCPDDVSNRVCGNTRTVLAVGGGPPVCCTPVLMRAASLWEPQAIGWPPEDGDPTVGELRKLGQMECLDHKQR